MKILGWVVIGLVLLVALAWIWGWAKLKMISWAATVQMWQDVQGKNYGIYDLASLWREYNATPQ